AGLNVNLRVRQEEEGVISRELVTRRFTDVVEHEAWTGPATLELRPNAQLPAHLLAVREVILGLHRSIDLTLSPGRIIHRYPGGPPPHSPAPPPAAPTPSRTGPGQTSRAGSMPPAPASSSAASRPCSASATSRCARRWPGSRRRAWWCARPGAARGWPACRR